ncbi:uncharacterized protein OCT59_001327 [Rhizophagus irregularis]|uniref:uncharacterized protein n=1 Tax=Rhizophagus irregularis TaxID=588596 RepID=UPI003325BE6D|nr:hypothetical protein OCT59_001327 [Rhizophagus irregularis]
MPVNQEFKLYSSMWRYITKTLPFIIPIPTYPLSPLLRLLKNEDTNSHLGDGPGATTHFNGTKLKSFIIPYKHKTTLRLFTQVTSISHPIYLIIRQLIPVELANSTI